MSKVKASESEFNSEVSFLGLWLYRSSLFGCGAIISSLVFSCKNTNLFTHSPASRCHITLPPQCSHLQRSSHEKWESQQTWGRSRNTELTMISYMICSTPSLQTFLFTFKFKNTTHGTWYHLAYDEHIRSHSHLCHRCSVFFPRVQLDAQNYL